MSGFKFKLPYIPQRTLQRGKYNVKFKRCEEHFGNSIYNMDISQYLNEQCGLNEHRGQIDSNDGFKEEGLGSVER